MIDLNICKIKKVSKTEFYNRLEKVFFCYVDEYKLRINRAGNDRILELQILEPNGEVLKERYYYVLKKNFYDENEDGI